MLRDYWRHLLIIATMTANNMTNKLLATRFVNSIQGDMTDKKAENLYNNREQLKELYNNYVQTLIK